MRCFLSFAVACSILCSAVVPTSGQSRIKNSQSKAVETKEKGGQGLAKGRPSEPPGKLKHQQGNSRTKTKFGSVRSVSEQGSGAWVLWQMESELKNAGFYVYRLDSAGETIVSKFIPGSWLTTGDEVLTGREYNFYDPKGSQGSAYLVEAISDTGKILRTKYVVPEWINSIDDLPGGERIRTETFAAKAGEELESRELNVSAELQTEIQLGMIVPNPTRHREVISTPGSVRVSSKADGLIRVMKADLQAAGFDVNSDPSTWQIYMDGVELPMIIGPNADYIEFLGEAVDTLETNIRSYYLIPGTSPGKRIASQFVRLPQATVRGRSYDQVFTDERKIWYTSDVLNGTAENWWGDVCSFGFLDYKFDLSGIDRTPGTRKLTISFQGLTFTAHSVELILNGTVLSNVTGSGRAPFQASYDVPVSSLLDGQNTLRMRSVGLGFSNGSPVPGDISYVDKLTIDFPRDYVAIGNQLEFYTDNFKNAYVSGFSSQNIRVFDTTFQTTPRLLTGLEVVQTNGTWGPTIPAAARGRVLYAIEAGVFGTATVSPNDPNLLGDPSNAGKLIIIAHPSLMASANEWAAYRSDAQTAVKVVDSREIYDEFGFGLLSSYAIEDFLAYAKNNWQTPPQYVLLIGDGHYDVKNYDSFDPGMWNMVPTRWVDTLFSETGSDDALTDFNNDGLAEIPIGRIAGRTDAVVRVVLDKVKAWEQGLNSMNRGVLFAHDWPDRWDFKAMSDRIMATLPPAVPKLSISQTSPTAQTDIITAVNETDGGTVAAPGPNAGQYLLNYTGHGSATVWRNNAFFSAAQAPSLTNAKYPSLMISLTCLNGYFMTDFDSFAEAMTKASNGGAVAVWASTGLTTPDVQELMATRFYTKLGEGTLPRLGDLVNDAKAIVPAGADVRLSWALLGDPMLKVH